MRLFVFLLVCVLPGMQEMMAQQMVSWQESQPLSWKNFKGKIPSNASQAAVTHTTIDFQVRLKQQSAQYNITCYFDESLSWGKIKNTDILAHEQLHFDITELHARRFCQSLTTLAIIGVGDMENINQRFKRIMADMQQMQHTYDIETDFSRNQGAQKKWSNYIKQQIRELERYKNYAAFTVEDMD
jgi:predicted secreted Zn-dependent protease